MTWVDVAGAAVANQELTRILILGPRQGLRGGPRRWLLSMRAGQKGRSGGSRGASTRGRSGYEGPVGGGGASGEAAAGG